MQHPAQRAVLAALLLAFFDHAHARECSVNGQPVNPDNGNTTQGKTGMMVCKDRDSGELLREQELQNGRLVGLMRYYQSGKLEREHSVNAQGNKHGRARVFAPTGQVLRDESYDNGSTVGLALGFHHNGRLARATFHEGAQGQGPSAEFTPSGLLRELRCGSRPVLAPAVDDARLCGFGGRSEVEMFRDNGKLVARATYVGGRRLRFETLDAEGKPARQEEIDGAQLTERSFWPDGVKRREARSTIVDAGRRLDHEQEFAESGALLEERRWTQGELSSEQSFYLNGQPRSKTLHGREGAARTLQSSEYHDNGVLAREGRYRVEERYRRVQVGAHRAFDAAGRPIAESVYDERGRLTRERAWDESGQLLRDDAVFEDGSRRAFSRPGPDAPPTARP